MKGREIRPTTKNKPQKIMQQTQHPTQTHFNQQKAPPYDERYINLQSYLP